MNLTINLTSSSSPCKEPSPPSKVFYEADALLYIFGILGNLWALIIIFRSREQNKTHLLMLGCLMSNDLMAFISMLVEDLIRLGDPVLMDKLWMCRYEVLARIFVFYSIAVVALMGYERYLALTKPFYYRAHIDAGFIGRFLFGLFLICLILVCGPFFEFGVYYDKECQRCVLFRFAEKPVDKAYAYLIVFLGSLLIIFNVWCNWAVVMEVFYKKHSKRCKESSRINPAMGVTESEVWFSKLMVVLSVIFIICWLPQMIAIPLAQFLPEHPVTGIFFQVAHVLVVAHFVLDPYLYVLQRWPPIRSRLKSCCQRRRRSTRDDNDGNGEETVTSDEDNNCRESLTASSKRNYSSIT